MSLSQFEEAVRHRRGADGGPAEAGEHGGEVVAAVEAVLELGQIARDVLVADRENGGGKVCHGSGGIVPLPAE